MYSVNSTTKKTQKPTSTCQRRVNAQEGGGESGEAARKAARLINGVSHHARPDHADKLSEVDVPDGFRPADIKVIRVDGHTNDAGVLDCDLLGHYCPGDPWCLQSRQCTSLASVEGWPTQQLRISA